MTRPSPSSPARRGVRGRSHPSLPAPEPGVLGGRPPALAAGRAAGCREGWGPGAGRTGPLAPTVFSSRPGSRRSALRRSRRPRGAAGAKERRAGAAWGRRRGRAQKREPHSRAALRGTKIPKRKLGARSGAEKAGLASLCAPPRAPHPGKADCPRSSRASPPGPGALWPQPRPLPIARSLCPSTGWA